MNGTWRIYPPMRVTCTVSCTSTIKGQKEKKNCSKVSASAVQSTDVWWVDQRREGVFRSSPGKATTNLPGRLVISGVINYRHQHH